MKKTVIATISLILIAALSVSFAACKRPMPSMVNNVSLNMEQAVLVTGEEFSLSANVEPAEATNKTVNWSSSNTDVVTVDSNGKCVAVGVGAATVTATTADGGKTGDCTVFVGDFIVDAAQSSETSNVADITGGAEQLSEEQNEEDEEESTNNDFGGVLGVTLFRTIGEAMVKVTEHKTILIMEADYDEDVTASASVTLLGIGRPVLKSFASSQNGVEIVLKSLAFSSDAYPSGGNATVMIPQGAKVTIDNCTFIINSSEPLSGGFAILADKQTQKIAINDCTIANYRYGIYINPTDQEIEIRDNSFSNLKTGIGVDIRQENSEPPANYPTRGSIRGNQFNEVEKNTQFFHYGEAYDGDFDFSDFEDQMEEDDQLDVT